MHEQRCRYAVRYLPRYQPQWILAHDAGRTNRDNRSLRRFQLERQFHAGIGAQTCNRARNKTTTHGNIDLKGRQSTVCRIDHGNNNLGTFPGHHPIRCQLKTEAMGVGHENKKHGNCRGQQPRDADNEQLNPPEGHAAKESEDRHDCPAPPS